MSASWRGSERVDRYGVVRGALWLLVLSAVMLVVAVPVYFAMQVALTLLWVAL